MSSYYNANFKVIRDDEEDENSRLKIDKWIFILLIFAIAIVPLIVGGYATNVMSPNITTIDLISSGLKGDIFTHYKLIALMIISILAISLLLVKVFFLNGVIRETKVNVFLGLFLISIVISTVLSPSKMIALWGQYNRSDGAIAYLCYLTLFFIAMNIVYPKKALQYVMYSLYPLIIINLALITMNFYGHDALGYNSVQKLMTLFLPQGGSLGEGAILLGTLNQWNFMSGTFSVLAMMLLASAIVDDSKIRSFINTFFSIASISIVLMSISTSGFLTIIIMMPLLFMLILKKSSKKQSLIVLSMVVLIVLPIFHILAEKDARVWDESIGFLIKNNPYSKDQPVSVIPTKTKYLFENTVYAAENNFELPKLPERGVAAGSGRTYIWSKTVELTMNRPLVGYGLDTIMYNFPHYNIDARAGMYYEDTLVDKPHSMYIGIFYGTGIIGSFGFLGLLVITVLMAVGAIGKKSGNSAAVFAVAWLAFLIQALFNDSLPGTTAPMWTISGMMIAFMIENKNVEEISNGRND